MIPVFLLVYSYVSPTTSKSFKQCLGKAHASWVSLAKANVQKQWLDGPVQHKHCSMIPRLHQFKLNLHYIFISSPFLKQNIKEENMLTWRKNHSISEIVEVGDHSSIGQLFHEDQTIVQDCTLQLITSEKDETNYNSEPWCSWIHPNMVS